MLYFLFLIFSVIYGCAAGNRPHKNASLSVGRFFLQE
jgi:hypothetical protein